MSIYSTNLCVSYPPFLSFPGKFTASKLFRISLLNDVIFFCEGLLQTVSFLEVIHGAIGGFCKV